MMRLKAAEQLLESAAAARPTKRVLYLAEPAVVALLKAGKPLPDAPIKLAGFVLTP
jgi:hypothetical protein